MADQVPGRRRQLSHVAVSEEAMNEAKKKMADQVPGRRRQLTHVAVSEEAMNEAKKAQEHLNSFFKKVSEQGIIPVTGDDNDKKKEQLQEEEKEDLKVQNRKLGDEILELKKKVEQEHKKLNEVFDNLQYQDKTVQDLLDTRNKHLQHISTLENDVKKYKQDIDDRDRTIMSLGKDWESLSKEHNDLKSRFSKLAGHKLTDQNPDLSDPSDPNRAMKLSDKFGALYDDAWTDAFEHLTGKQKQNPRDVIQFLLERLKDCWEICKKVADTWMESLQQEFLHPVQDKDAMSKMAGEKMKLRLGSKEQRLVRDACRKIAPTVGVLVKQYFLTQMKANKLTNDCLTYLEGCVDVCWLMVLAEPPLHIDFNIKQGDKFDQNRHTAYSSSGETVEFLVWPPLYNALAGGGMLSKGTVSTEKKIVKQKK